LTAERYGVPQSHIQTEPGRCILARGEIERMIETMADEHKKVGDSYRSRLMRTVSPSIVVAVDLGALYGKTAHFQPPADAGRAVQLNVIALGYLESWILAVDQGWFGMVSYRVAIGDNHFIDQVHLVPQWALKQPAPSEVVEARKTGQLRW
jgi:hypothetical protein